MFQKLHDKNFAMSFVVSVLLAAIVLRLVVLQVVEGESYLVQSKNKLTN